MLKVGINGFGRIGRLFLRRSFEKDWGFKVVMVNTSGSMEPKDWAHLFEYDTVYGRFKGEVAVSGSEMRVNGQSILITGERDPKKIAWNKKEVDLVVEATGVFRKEEQVSWHLGDSVKRVLLSAPGKGGKIPMKMLGINAKNLGKDEIWSNASCTTNCVAPVMQVVKNSLGVKKAIMTTIHAYTDSQRLLDNSHKDLRRARAAAQNVIPTTTGAAKATGEVIPELKGVFDGLAIRVPVPTGSLADIVVLTETKTTADKVNKILADASKSPLYQGVLAVSKQPLVSSDIVGQSASSIVDLGLTRVIDGNLVKIIAWYDNEWGYVCRLVDQVEAASKVEVDK